MFRVFTILAQQTINIERPELNNRPVGYSDLGNFINNIITLAFIIAIILVLTMLILGGVEWISSGGDKETVAKARGRIIHALIGLAIIAVAFAIFRVAGMFLGLDVTNLTIPSPGR